MFLVVEPENWTVAFLLGHVAEFTGEEGCLAGLGSCEHKAKISFTEWSQCSIKTVKSPLETTTLKLLINQEFQVIVRE